MYAVRADHDEERVRERELPRLADEDLETERGDRGSHREQADLEPERVEEDRRATAPQATITSGTTNAAVSDAVDASARGCGGRGPAQTRAASLAPNSPDGRTSSTTTITT